MQLTEDISIRTRHKHYIHSIQTQTVMPKI